MVFQDAEETLNVLPWTLQPLAPYTHLLIKWVIRRGLYQKVPLRRTSRGSREQRRVREAREYRKGRPAFRIARPETKAKGVQHVLVVQASVLPRTLYGVLTSALEGGRVAQHRISRNERSTCSTLSVKHPLAAIALVFWFTTWIPLRYGRVIGAGVRASTFIRHDPSIYHSYLAISGCRR